MVPERITSMFWCEEKLDYDRIINLLCYIGHARVVIICIEIKTLFLGTGQICLGNLSCRCGVFCFLSLVTLTAVFQISQSNMEGLCSKWLVCLINQKLELHQGKQWLDENTITDVWKECCVWFWLFVADLFNLYSMNQEQDVEEVCQPSNSYRFWTISFLPLVYEACFQLNQVKYLRKTLFLFIPL